MSQHEFEAPRPDISPPGHGDPGDGRPDLSDTEFRTQPDHVHLQPGEFDYRDPIVCDPPLPPDNNQVSREELELALERAKLVAEDCATILEPALQAMQDGAWVSRRADEFSLALEENVRIATTAAERPIQIIEQALNQRLGPLDTDEPVFEVPRAGVEL